MAHKNPEECMLIKKVVPSAGYCRLTFRAPRIAEMAEPGQFVMVHMPPEQKYLLPRPLSVHLADRSKGTITLLFEVKGTGTGLMSGALEGSTWKMAGPLGRGFPVLPPHALLIAGGIGIAPLVFLAASSEKPHTLIFGGRTASQLACLPEELDLPNLTMFEVTEDGSRGQKGLATDYLTGLLPSAPALFACGPRPMLAMIKELCMQAKVPAWFSVEERMACGIGACVGCVVRTRQGYKRVCCDGPVFAAEEVLLHEKA
ncbi:MAG: dihydroorotate dehydrogenase electron transfer subunit [Bacillota bacterium]